MSLYRVRGIAMYFVIAAHFSYVGIRQQRISSIIGLLGVPIFFFCSGLFLDIHTDIKTFWKRKLRSIIAPWIIMGGLTYIVHALSARSFSIIEYLKWIMGCYTWIYYIPVLLFLIVLFRLSGTSKEKLIIFGILSFVCNLLYVIKVLDNFSYFTAYQNPLSWLLFFELGIICKNDNIRTKLKNINAIGFCLICFCVFFFSFIISNTTVSYWAVFSIPMELSFIPIALSFSSKLKGQILSQMLGKILYLYISSICSLGKELFK